MALADKVVLITGATGGIGPVVVRTLAATGARLVLTARRQGALETLVAEQGLDPERTLPLAANLADSASAQALMQTVTERWGGVDILLNLAGGWVGGQRIVEMSEATWDETLASNLRAAFLINRAVLPYMLKQGWGRIVNFGSKAAVDPGARQAAYNVAKAGVVALTASIAAEYRRQGVAANVILPSIIDTPENRQASPDADTSRWVKPEEVVALLLFLCSDEAGSLNGASIPLYGRV